MHARRAGASVLTLRSAHKAIILNALSSTIERKEGAAHLREVGGQALPLGAGPVHARDLRAGSGAKISYPKWI